MKDLIGRPGTKSGLALRMGQSAFAAASIGVMVSALGFSSFTAFWYCHLPLSLFFRLVIQHASLVFGRFR